MEYGDAPQPGFFNSHVGIERYAVSIEEEIIEGENRKRFSDVIGPFEKYKVLYTSSFLTVLISSALAVIVSVTTKIHHKDLGYMPDPKAFLDVNKLEDTYTVSTINTVVLLVFLMVAILALMVSLFTCGLSLISSSGQEGSSHIPIMLTSMLALLVSISSVGTIHTLDGAKEESETLSNQSSAKVVQQWVSDRYGINIKSSTAGSLIDRDEYWKSFTAVTEDETEYILHPYYAGTDEVVLLRNKYDAMEKYPGTKELASTLKEWQEPKIRESLRNDS